MRFSDCEQVPVRCPSALALLALAACQGPDEASEGWTVGETRTHQLRLDARLVPDEPGAVPMLAYEVSGTWRRTAVAHDPPLTHVVATLSDARLRTPMRDPATAAALGEAQAQLEAPVSASYDDRGALHAVRLPPELDGLAAGVLESALSLTQWVRPANDAEAWEVLERHSDGRVRVRYTLDGSSGTREKIRYVQAATALPDVVASSGEVEVDEEGRVVSVTLRETVRSEAHPVLGPIDAQTALELSGLTVSTTSTSSDAWTRLAKLPPRPIEQPRAASVDTSLRDRAAVKGRTLSELRDTLRRARSDDDDVARTEAFSGLVGLLRLRNETVVAARDAVLAEADDAAALISAMGHAGTPETQLVLRGFVTDSPLSRDLRDRALIALQRSDEPTEATVALYEQLLTDPQARRQALFGLGTAAMRLEQPAPDRSERIVGVLGRELAASSTDDGRVDVLRGLSNAGGAAAWPHVAPHLESLAVRVRSAAVDALHRVPQPAAEAHLVATVTDDASPVVRQAAIEALRRRAPTAPGLAALRKATADASYPVRAEAVRGLADALRTVPDVRPDLERIAEEEERPEIAKVAKDALARSKASTAGR